MEKDFSHLVGIPYSKVNCWDLTRMFYKDILNIELKHFSSDPDNRANTQSLIYSNKGEFTQVISPQFGDIMTLKVRGLESHIAVYVGNGLMLHTTKNTGSVVDRTQRWDKTITGYFRQS